jgi:hypothetical protein
MMTEKNIKLYWSWFAIFIGIIVVSAFAVDPLSTFFVTQKNQYKDLLGTAISLAPLPLMAFYGLFMNYFPGGWYNEIRRGKSAIIWNTLFVIIYTVALIYEGIKS